MILLEQTSKDRLYKKIRGEELSPEEIRKVVEDILDGTWADVDIAAWLVALEINGMTEKEIIAYAEAMVHTGTVFEFDSKNIFDFHSIGGISGNKITPIVVSIAAEAGLVIPKTSTHAISSACGTADFVETFCDIKFKKEETTKMLKKTNGLFIMGGFDRHCPADDIIIDVEYRLALNPQTQFYPSILGKKHAMSVNRLLIEIPTGPTAKIKTIEEARFSARDFMRYGKKLGMKVSVAITDAYQPIGKSVGSILEARECIEVLMHPENASPEIVEKVCAFCGKLIEMDGRKNGEKIARDILFSGKAYDRFRKIVKVQNGNPDVKPEDLKISKFKKPYLALKSGYVDFIDNKEIIKIAKAAGAPDDKVAGLSFIKKYGEKVEKGEPLFEIYSSTMKKVDEALKLAETIVPYGIGSKKPEPKEKVVLEILSD